MTAAVRQRAPSERWRDGPGKLATIVVWEDGAARQRRCKWGLAPRESYGDPISLLRSEARTIVNPCLIIASDFEVEAGMGSRRKRYSVRLVTDEPFFCFAGMWRPATDDWPEAFAALTTEAGPDVAPYKDRQLAVVRPEDWEDWLRQRRGVEDLLRPFPKGSFEITDPAK
ncbi:SOS response-associated peptidase family protein [Sphingosinicella microcystinivorans]|uniref:SOS response-associated peptidase family protein n=1 Tax=Sphingosinicella microcystinivorans TaxID=335406 RepID=UPI0022F3D350|nr:SOS response-associated peptidase family protein [Sphingosinicella microcystinivorans]WBX83522.1 SOS response-associated peptidase family protein [Sphingosinicella microcystinivorans]